MWNTSDRYKELIYNINTKCLLNIYIEDILIDDNALIDFRISHTLFSSDKIELGTTPSKAIELQIRAEALPEKYDNFYIETGINVDGKNEIVPIGYFTLESIEKDDDLVTLTIVDYMMMFERTLNIYKALPCTAINLLKYICNYCGVELGSTSFTNSDTIINIYDVNLTARQIIGYIAEQAGGFAFIGRNGKLYIKKIGKDTSKIDIELFQDYSWGEKFVCNEVDFDNEKQQYYISDTEVNGVDLDNVLDTSLYSNVEGRNIEINPNNLFINNKEQIENIYKEVKGLTLYGFEGQSIIDPALDIGDIVYIEGKPVVYQGEMEFTKKFKGNISSRIETEQKKSTTVGSALSYATRMRNLKGEVEEAQEQVTKFEKIKVDKTEIIKSINESSQTDDSSINPDKININGVESKNKKFGIDEDGNATLNEANINDATINNATINDAIINNASIANEAVNINKKGIQMADGTEIIGGKGILTNLQFKGGYGQFEEIGFQTVPDMLKNTKLNMKINIYIPNNFAIEKATIKLYHAPILYDNSFWGYCRNLKLFKGNDILSYYKKSYIGEEYKEEDNITYNEISNAFGKNGFTAKTPTTSSHSAEIIESIDISNNLSAGNNLLKIETSLAPPTWITQTESDYFINEKKCAPYTGLILAIADIIGFMKNK